MSSVLVRDLGPMAYGPALALQKQTQSALIEGGGQETFYFVEHVPPVLTLGRNSKPENLLVSEEQLAAQGIELFETGRGGDITYHGPGQLVGYPILALRGDEQDVAAYVWGLEDLMIRTCAHFGVRAERVDGLRGIWVGDEKIGAIGVRMSRWVTMHGFALNVSTNLEHFDLIIPCGLRGKGVTSLQKLTGREIALSEVKAVMVSLTYDCLARTPIETHMGAETHHPGDRPHV